MVVGKIRKIYLLNIFSLPYRRWEGRGEDVIYSSLVAQQTVEGSVLGSNPTSLPVKSSEDSRVPCVMLYRSQGRDGILPLIYFRKKKVAHESNESV